MVSALSASPPLPQPPGPSPQPSPLAPHLLCLGPAADLQALGLADGHLHGEGDPHVVQVLGPRVEGDALAAAHVLPAGERRVPAQSVHREEPVDSSLCVGVGGGGEGGGGRGRLLVAPLGGQRLWLLGLRGLRRLLLLGLVEGVLVTTGERERERGAALLTPPVDPPSAALPRNKRLPHRPPTSASPFDGKRGLREFYSGCED